MLVLLMALAGLGTGVARGQNAATTATSLTISSGGQTITTIRQGTMVTLTATVTLAGGTAAAAPGQVIFCFSNSPTPPAQLPCTDIHLMGLVQLSATGTASLNFYPGAGLHYYQAVFLGTHVEAKSYSADTALSVTPYYPTVSTVTSSGTPGNYTLTATVTTTGGTVAPTGTFNFLDTTNSNYLLATTSDLVANPVTFSTNFASTNLSTVNLSGASEGVSDFAMADFNGDGKPDFVTDERSVQGIWEIITILGNGDGTFSQQPIYSTINNLYNLSTNTIYSIAISDFNGDGIPDIAISSASVDTTTNGYNYSVLTYLGKGDGTFIAGPTLLAYQSVATIATSPLYIEAAGDFNGDGIADLILYFANNNSPRLQILFGNGDGSFQAGPTTAFPTSILNLLNEGGILTTVAGDFNGDEIPDLAVFATSETGPDVYTGAGTALLGNGDGTFSSTTAQNSTTGFPCGLVAADFEGIGNLDLAECSAFNPTLVTLFHGNGDGTFTQMPTQIVAPTTQTWYNDYFAGLAVGDFNGDGKADLVTIFWGQYGQCPHPACLDLDSALIDLGNGDGTFTQTASSLTTLVSDDVLPFASDFNGDGLTDIAFINGNDINVLLSEVGPQSATATVTGIGVVGTGTHEIDAAYSGDSAYQPSTSDTIPLTAEPIPTTLALVTNIPTTTYYDQSVQMTVTLTPNPNTPSLWQNHVPNGTVTFYSGTTALGSVAISGFTASLTTTGLSTGTDSITAVYANDLNFAISTSNAISETVLDYGSTTTLIVSPNPAYYAQTITLTATVAEIGSLYSPLPTGTVTFYNGTTQLATVALDTTGHATYTGTLPVGSYSITASYAGDAAYYPSVSSPSVSETVSDYTSATALSVTPSSPVNAGQTITLTAAVSEVGTLYSTLPTGTVTFYNGTAQLATATLDATAHASYTSVLPFGSYSLTAAYSGDAAYYASTSTPAVSEVVNGYHSTTILTPTPNPAGVGHPVTMSVAVAEVGNLYATLPAGSVTIYDGTTPITTLTLDATAHATYTTSALALGTHALTAVYAGNAAYYASTSPTVNEVLVTPDFTAALDSPSITLPTYQHITTVVTLTSVGELADSITLSCANLPAYVTCIFTPSTSALTSDGSASVSFYLDTDSDLGGRNGPAGGSASGPVARVGLAALHGNGAPGSPSLPSRTPVSLALLLSPVSLFVAIAARRRSRRNRSSLLVVVATLALPTLLAITSCGNSVITPIPSTAPGTYTIPITATGASGLTHTTQLTLVVTP